MRPAAWFSPNAQSDLIDLFRAPDRWAEARASCATLQLYTGAVLSDPKYVPNAYEALVEVDAFATLRTWGVPLALEAGAVKEWSPDARRGFQGTLEAIERVRGARGKVAAITMDEPRWAGAQLGQSLEDTAAATAWYVRALRALNLHLEVTLIEPYPALSMAEILRFIERIQADGGGPAGLHLDIDRYGLRDQGLATLKNGHVRGLKWSVISDVLEARRRCREWRIPFGVILFGQRVETAAAYAENVRRWAETVQPWDPDRLIVQSWEIGPSGRKDLPHNLPEGDPTSHTALLRDLARDRGPTT